MIISIISAISQNGVVGNKGVMPWKIPEEMKFFKEKTTNHPIIMGRKTWDSLYSKPLKNRYNIIVTRNTQLLNTTTDDDSVIYVESVEDGLNAADDITNEVFIIGGTEIWKHALDQGYVDRMYLNVLNDTYVGDTYFPYYNQTEWSREQNKEEYKSFRSYTLIKRNTD